MNRQLATLLIICPAIAVLLSACAGSGPSPQNEELTPATAGYLELQEQVHGRDLTALQQRRIVLDPGHGGYFRGALGPNGLTEAEVNLGVALHLRGLLEWAGAQVWLTRSADVDFLSPSDSTLASDLAMRVSLSDSLQPDVFISIHHNSNASLDPTINETQTYYPLTDDGASLDLARSIHRHLVLNLGIEPASILPGNFHVLRNATVPAVLGEPAMISHPVMAERLSFAASQRLEAEAYFLGLLDYFSTGLPAWSGASSDTVLFGNDTASQSITWQFLPDGNRPLDADNVHQSTSPGLDPTQIRLTLDGQALTPEVSPDARRIRWELPTDLSRRPHVLAISGRNLAGRATPPRSTLLLPMAGSAPAVTVIKETGGENVALIWHSPDGGPLPSGDLRLGETFTTHIGPNEPTAAWAPSQPPLTDASFLADGAAVSVPVQLLMSQLPDNQQLRLPSHDGAAMVASTASRKRLGGSHKGSFLIVPANSPAWYEYNGVQPLIDPDPSLKNTPRTVPHQSATWPVTEILPGLTSRTIVLDPTGGGTIVDGTGPLGMRGADLNLLVAQQAAQLLRGAGATVYLTRSDEAQVPDVEKVRFAGQIGADLFLTIGRHSKGGPRTVSHHPGSDTGQLWAATAQQASFLLPTPQGSVADTCLVAPSSAYLLRHTACPALNWTFDPPQTGTDEMLQWEPGWARAEARAILLSIAAISGHPQITEQLIDLPRVLASIAELGGPSPHSVDWAMLDGNLMWSPMPEIASVAGVENSITLSGGPGLPALLPQHVLELHFGDQWQLWLLVRNNELWRPLLMLASNVRPESLATP